LRGANQSIQSKPDQTFTDILGQANNTHDTGMWQDDLQMQKIKGCFMQLCSDALGSEDTDPANDKSGDSVADSSKADTQATGAPGISKSRPKQAPNKTGQDGNLNEAEIAIKRHQALIKKERREDVAKKADLILEMHGTQACNWSQVNARKTFMKRAFKIARCIHACCNGDKVAFSRDHKSLDTFRFNCRNGMDHFKPRGVHEGDLSVGMHHNQHPSQFDS
jgi:hypothetical protein